MSHDVDIQNVKHLRGLTGAGVLDCRNALAQTDGDIEQARKLLAREGKKASRSRRDRVAEEGRVALADNSRGVSMVKLVCETDFAARTEHFEQMARRAARHMLEQTRLTEGKILPGRMLLARDPQLSYQLDELRNQVGQRVELERVVKLSQPEQGQLGHYLHMDQTVGSLIEIEAELEVQDTVELAHEMAMQVAALDPLQPSNMLASSFIREPQMTVRRYLQEVGGATIHRFFRFATKR